MQERIEPPILISRLMAFVMATALVVLVVLLVTLDKMFPLNRPQVFFLTTQELGDKELTLTQIPENLEDYKKHFIREYVRYRNEIIPDMSIMRARWAPVSSGIIKSRSTDTVFGKFADTEMVNVIRRENLDEAFTVKCSVEFPRNDAVVLPKIDEKNTYIVDFSYVCSYGDSDSVEHIESYEIKITLESTEKTAVKWAERMENPLGFRVTKYEVLNGQPDPLDNVVFEE